MPNEQAESKHKALISTVDHLNQQAWELWVADSTQAFELSKETLRLSEEIQYEQGNMSHPEFLKSQNRA